MELLRQPHTSFIYQRGEAFNPIRKGHNKAEAVFEAAS